MSDSHDPAAHRPWAVSLFNETWSLMKQPTRSCLEDDEMIHGAHASRYHWGHAGGPTEWARGEWQISRVYWMLGRLESCRKHAERCLELCQEHNLSQFDLGCAHEAFARCLAASGDTDAAWKHRAEGLEIAAGIEDEEDRDLLVKDLESIMLD